MGELKRHEPVGYFDKRIEAEGMEKNFVNLDALTTPREVYEKGEFKLDYSYTYSTGETFVAKEDSDGIVTAVIEKDGIVLADFSQMAKALGYQLISASYILNNPDLRKQGFKPGEWSASPKVENNNKYIGVGDLKSPQLILALLHEMGHAEFDTKHSQKDKYSSLIEQMPKTVRQNTKPVLRSIFERNAWARALKIVRDIRKDHKLNLLEVFSDFEDFKNFMYTALADHRYGNELDDIKSRNYLQKLWHSLRPSALEQKIVFHQDYFDKKKLSKSPQGVRRSINKDVIKMNKIRKDLDIN